MGMKQKKKKKIRKKNSKWPIQKKLIFQNRQFSKIFRENFSDLNDAKGIDVAQDIWP